jgi:hypothetical protein
VYLAVYVFTRSKYQALENQNQLLEKLLVRGEELKRAKTVPADTLDSQVAEYMMNEEVNKYTS